MRHNLSNHLGIHNSNRQILLANGFPVDTAELIDLLYEVFYVALWHGLNTTATKAYLHTEGI